eukprot:superscaffoldBa00000637_g6222
MRDGDAGRVAEDSDVVKQLSALGLTDAWDQKVADFSGVSDKSKGKLHLGGVLHWASLELAAQAGKGSADLEEENIEKPKMFYADHPFIMFVRDNATGALLLMGALDHAEGEAMHDELSSSPRHHSDSFLLCFTLLHGQVAEQLAYYVHVSETPYREKSIKDNYTSNMYRYLASLTDDLCKKAGNIVLYIPKEGLQRSPEEASKDKKPVQRLETTFVPPCPPYTGLSSFSSITSDQGATEQPRNIEDEGHLCPPARDSLLEDLLCQSHQPAAAKATGQADQKHHTALQMSNEIIRLCFQSISLDRLFEGYVIFSKQNLSNCIQCCLAWKEIYLHASQIDHKYHTSELVTHAANITVSSKGWVLDQTSIFVLVDAFVQRLRDLLELARWEEGQQRVLPHFGGHQGPEVTRCVLEIQSNLHHCLQIVHFVGTGILDVKTPPGTMITTVEHDMKKRPFIVIQNCADSRTAKGSSEERSEGLGNREDEMLDEWQANHSMLFECEPPPQTLVELPESLKLLETLQGDLAKTEAQIPLIHEQFAILDKYEIPVEEAGIEPIFNPHLIHSYQTADTGTGPRLCDELQCSFDQSSAEFTLDKIISLGFNKYGDSICEISWTASEELSIGQVQCLPLD